MIKKPITFERQILSNSEEFKAFWKKNGPFKYALTSMDFPPVMLEPEEWVFSDSATILLKELMQFDKRKMKIIQAAFNPKNTNILRPEKLIPWKINNFPEEWNQLSCDFFVPNGHLTLNVLEQIRKKSKNPNIETVNQSVIESAFFQCLEKSIEQTGYLMFKPEQGAKYADIKKYLLEWEKDDRDAGLL